MLIISQARDRLLRQILVNKADEKLFWQNHSFSYFGLGIFSLVRSPWFPLR
ncbi:hypothetical protein [Oscillatoria acuminata]|uniref:hypothetical protein n=1 Tax=Oscillatoria acuminata TaxID=118323 RepID=UPI0002D41A93|nr:hypothetical protein [Oscillatoria acuminata]